MLLKIHLQPGARRNEIAGRYGDAIKIKIKAPPIEGRANKELIEFLAETLSIKSSDITIKSGLASRQKLVEIAGDELTIRNKLGGF